MPLARSLLDRWEHFPLGKKKARPAGAKSSVAALCAELFRQIENKKAPFRALFYIPAVWREGKGAFAQPFFFLETTTTTAMTTTTAAAMPMMMAVSLVLAAGSAGVSSAG